MTEGATIEFKARRFRSSELELIRGVVASFPGLSRQELANTVCELVDWRRANGGLKTWECQELLEELESRRLVELPARRQTKPLGSVTSVPRTGRGEPQEPIEGTVGEVGTVALRRVSSKEDRLLWRELVGRYHYLGHKVPFGAHLRYLIEIEQPVAVVGCLQLSSPAWKMAARDRWIGWSDAVRQKNLQRVVNNSRFLLLPWVKVRNLASSVLAQMARELVSDWQRAYGVQPLLLETLVDTERYQGTCYRAANWLELGVTTGRGRNDRRTKRQRLVPKRVYVYRLVKGARSRLRGEM